jgi:nitrogen-specific signal transduction histidine kinase
MTVAVALCFLLREESGHIETFTTGILITDAKGMITLCNGEAEKILQITKAGVIGRTEGVIIEALDLPSDTRLQEYFTNKEVVINEGIYLVSRVRIQKGEPYTVTVINDITELTKNKRQIEKFKMFSAIGELAAGVAHEVRNPMTTIRGFMQLTENNLKDTRYQPMSQMVVDELDRINCIVDGLMQMTPQKVEAYKVLNLNDVINKVWDLYTCEGQAKGIQYSKDLFTPLPAVYGNQKQIQQVISNLMQNAEKACPNGGLITIKTYINNKQEVCFDITDNGSGIAPDDLDKIIIPLYKGDFSGTGFGLPICNRIISEHKGFLDINSQQNVGTIVTVRLPQANDDMES